MKTINEIKTVSDVVEVLSDPINKMLIEREYELKRRSKKCLFCIGNGKKIDSKKI
jgi:hypothetical protein